MEKMTEQAPAQQSLPLNEDFRVMTALKNARLLRIEILAGLVVALALIPEAISFSVLAGVDPSVGLYASFTMAITIAFTGGRKGMISAATGAIALVVAPIAKKYGIDYLVATVILGGLIQIGLSFIGITKLMRFIPRSVMIGFVNALAILIFMAQIPELIEVPWEVYPMAALGLAAIFAIPKLTTSIPSPLIVIIVLTTLTIAFGIQVPNVGEAGTLPTSLPSFLIPDIPYTFATFKIIAPVSLAMALVGLLESLLTAKLVDDITDSHSEKQREGWGQGVANIVTGFFGGMGGCAMIGQTMINVKVSGARTRISTFLSGAFLLGLIIGLGDTVSKIPMAALVAVMVMVSIKTFDWHSIHPKTLKFMPVSATSIMVVTVLVTVFTKNLAYGVISGVIVAIMFFAKRVAHFVNVEDVGHPDENTKIYEISGVLFFASSNDLVYQFDYANDPENIVIDLTKAQVYDSSTIAALDGIITKYHNKGKKVTLEGIDIHSQRWHDLSGRLGAGH